MKTLPFSFILAGAVLLLASWVAWPQGQVSAQCGTRASSCKTCHETQRKFPVKTKGDWHVQHNFGDLCVFCHGGNAQSADKATAHTGMFKPLEAIDVSCASCHTDDCDGRAEKYAVILKVTPNKSGGKPLTTTFTPFVPRMPGPAGENSLGPAPLVPAGSLPTTPAETEERVVNWGNVTLATAALGLLLGGGGYAWWNESSRSRKIQVSAPLRPEVQDMLPKLEQADAKTLQAIAQQLQKGEQLTKDKRR